MENRLKVSILTRNYIMFENIIYRRGIDIDEIVHYLKEEIDDNEIFMMIINRLKRAKQKTLDE